MNAIVQSRCIAPHAAPALLLAALLGAAPATAQVSRRDAVVEAVERVSPGVVPRGSAIGAEIPGVIEERAELDLAVAEKVRLGGSACTVLVEKFFEFTVPVRGGEIAGVQWDAEPFGNSRRMRGVLSGPTCAEAVVLLPVL